MSVKYFDWIWHWLDDMVVIWRLTACFQNANDLCWWLLDWITCWNCLLLLQHTRYSIDLLINLFKCFYLFIFSQFNVFVLKSSLFYIRFWALILAMYRHKICNLRFVNTKWLYRIFSRCSSFRYSNYRSCMKVKIDCRLKKKKIRWVSYKQIDWFLVFFRLWFVSFKLK